MPKDLIPPYPAELVSQITSVIRTSGVSIVHYTGHADEGLLRAGCWPSIRRSHSAS